MAMITNIQHIMDENGEEFDLPVAAQGLIAIPVLRRFDDANQDR